jgi:hypothetical protein
VRARGDPINSKKKARERGTTSAWFLFFSHGMMPKRSVWPTTELEWIHLLKLESQRLGAYGSIASE